MSFFIALGWMAAAGTASAVECGTAAFFEEIRTASPQPAVSPPPSSGKAQREAHGGCAGSQTSENFVVKWGLDGEPDVEELEAIIAALETSWRHELNVMNHAQPYGSTTHLFNVYVGDSGDCAPSAMGMGGYYTVDPEGWPMIVLSQGVFDNPDYGRTTVAHEFYHAVQHAEQSYLNDPAAQWWWEATAMWVEALVYPETRDYFVFLFGYAFEPHRQLNSYTYPSEGRLEEYHQYGAAIWPRYLTEFVTDWSTIRDSWSSAGPDDDPMEVLSSLMGEDLAPHFADFAAHNATWDYVHGEEMEDYLDTTSMTSDFGSRDRRIVESHGFEGTGAEWTDPPESTLPERYGYNVIRMKSPPEGELTIRFRGDEAGSAGSSATWAVRVVRELSQRVEYYSMEIAESEGSLVLDLFGTERAIYLVPSVTSPAWNQGENFDYQYQFDAASTDSGGDGGTAPGWPSVPKAIDSGDDEPVGCQCASGRPPSGLWVLLLPLLAAARRDAW